jgi:hypothetical protein
MCIFFWCSPVVGDMFAVFSKVAPGSMSCVWVFLCGLVGSLTWQLRTVWVVTEGIPCICKQYFSIRSMLSSHK